MRTIAMIGTGYVGLVTGACFAELGNQVVCLDVNEPKVALLRSGQLPFFEPFLLELVTRNQQAGRLMFSTGLEAGIKASEVIFIAVGTPMGDDGHADLGAVRSAAQTIGRALNGPKIVAYKSTVPVQTGDLIVSIIDEFNLAAHPVHVVSNPEFLREGSAVADFMKPDRIIIGTADADAEAVLTELYAPLEAPIVVVDVRTAEMIKYTSNAFLATKITFINEIANICELVGADIKAVCRGIGYDHRIGTEFFNAGLGYGGSCFPKDMRALASLAASRDYEPALLRAVDEVNARQVTRTLDKLEGALGPLAGKTIAVLGLAFKPNTDDTRDSPAIAAVRGLLARGAAVQAHDPVAAASVRADIASDANITFPDDVYQAMSGADAVLLATEWNEYKTIDFARVRALMRGGLILDGRNIFDPHKVRAAGLEYIGVGRPVVGTAQVRA